MSENFFTRCRYQWTLDRPVYLREVGAGPAHRGRIDDGGHLVEVVFQNPVEEYLVAVVDGLQHLRKQVTTLVQ